MKRSLSKPEIIRDSKTIKGIYQSGLGFSTKGMKMYVRTNEGTGTRVLVSSVRSYGNAVERNYARRVGKELFRSCKDRIMTGHDLIFVFYPGAYGFADREKQFLSLLHRAHILT